MSRHPNIGKKNVTVSPNWGKIVTVSQNRRKIVTVSQNPNKKSLSTLMQPRTDQCSSVGKTRVIYTVQFAESWLVLFRRGLSSHLQSSAARAVSFRFFSCVFFFQVAYCSSRWFCYNGLVPGGNLRFFALFSDLPRTRSPYFPHCKTARRLPVRRL